MYLYAQHREGLLCLIAGLVASSEPHPKQSANCLPHQTLRAQSCELSFASSRLAGSKLVACKCHFPSRKMHKDAQNVYQNALKTLGNACKCITNVHLIHWSLFCLAVSCHCLSARDKQWPQRGRISSGSILCVTRLAGSRAHWAPIEKVSRRPETSCGLSERETLKKCREHFVASAEFGFFVGSKSGSSGDCFQASGKQKKGQKGAKHKSN